MGIVNKISDKIIKFPMVFFLVASAVQYRKIIFEGKKIGWDTLDAIFPHFLYMVDCFKNGTFPYYNPLIMGGFSFGKNFFTAFLLNPLDVFIALLGTVTSPLYIFHLQFPIFAMLSGYWFYKYLKRVNHDDLISILGGLAYFSGILFPLAGQSPFFYSFVLFTFLLTPFQELVLSKKMINILAAIIFLATFLLKSYFFFIPFLMLGAFLLIYKNHQRSLLYLFISLAAGSVIYLIITYPVLAYLKSSLSDLNGTFISPEPRLRSLNPEQIFFNSSIINVMGDIIDSRLVRGGAWTKGFNLSLVFLFIVQLYILVKQKVNVRKLSTILFLMIFTMFIARGSFNSLHKALPLLGSFRWGFSYVHFSQICYLLFICSVPLAISTLNKKDKILISSVFSLFLIWVLYQSENYNTWVVLVPVLLLIFVFYKKEKNYIFTTLLFCFVYLFKPANFTGLDNKGEYEKIKSRISQVSVVQNYRDEGSKGDYLFEDRSWLYEKKTTLNGYNNSIHPIFWYLKGHKEASEFLIPICNMDTKIKERKDYPLNDNEYLEAFRDDLLNYIKSSRCNEIISTLTLDGDEMKFTPISSRTLVLQNLAGFNNLNGSNPEEILPGGIKIIDGIKGEEVNYQFDKTSSVFNKIFLVLSFCIGFVLVVSHFKKLRLKI